MSVSYEKARRKPGVVEALLAMEREGILRSQEVVRAQILKSRARSLVAVVFSVSLINI